MNLYPYDCECYPNIFTLDIKELHTGRWWLFEISDRRNDSDALREFLADLHNTPNVWMVGFNNIHYDYELVHHFMVNLNGQADAMAMYTKSCQIFQDTDYRLVWASDRLIRAGARRGGVGVQQFAATPSSPRGSVAGTHGTARPQTTAGHSVPRRARAQSARHS